MARFALRHSLLAGGVVAVIAATALTAAAQPAASPPDFQSGQAAWIHPPGGAFPAVPGSPPPMRQDPAHRYVGNNTGAQPTYRIGMLLTPI